MSQESAWSTGIFTFLAGIVLRGHLGTGESPRGAQSCSDRVWVLFKSPKSPRGKAGARGWWLCPQPGEEHRAVFKV